MITRRSMVQGTLAAAAAWPSIARAAAETASLKAAAAKNGLRYGASSDQRLDIAEPRYQALFLDHCELFAPILSWKYVMPSATGTDPAVEDPDLRFAAAHGMDLTGGHLLWHEALPPWFVQQGDPVKAQSAALAHIHAITEHYRGKMFSWNVVNEALLPRDGRPDGLRNSPLLAKLGADFFDIAFRAARSGDPEAFLAYNDYNLETDQSEPEAKRAALLRLLDRFAEDGTPIDAVGLQSHLALDGSHFDEQRYRAFLAEIAARKLKIIITELDVLDVAAPTDHAARDQQVADMYARFLNVALDEKAVVAVVNWGLSDRYTWLVPANAAKFARHDNEPTRPLPFDDQFAPKPAFAAILNALSHAPSRDPVRRRLK